MSIQVLFFGATADIVGKRSIEVELTSALKASEIFGQLTIAHPSLAKHRLHFSINQQFATGEEIVRDGDELAIFAAVSGG